jgi:hypothetical protein
MTPEQPSAPVPPSPRASELAVALLRSARKAVVTGDELAARRFLADARRMAAGDRRAWTLKESRALARALLGSFEIAALAVESFDRATVGREPLRVPAATSRPQAVKIGAIALLAAVRLRPRGVAKLLRGSRFHEALSDREHRFDSDKAASEILESAWGLASERTAGALLRFALRQSDKGFDTAAAILRALWIKTFCAPVFGERDGEARARLLLGEAKRVSLGWTADRREDLDRVVADAFWQLAESLFHEEPSREDPLLARRIAEALPHCARSFGWRGSCSLPAAFSWLFLHPLTFEAAREHLLPTIARWEGSAPISRHGYGERLPPLGLALFRAVQADNPRAVAALLDAAPNRSEALVLRNERGLSFSHALAWARSEPMLRLLREGSPDLRWLPDSGRPLLSQCQNERSLLLLANAGADPAQRSLRGEPLAFLLAMGPNPELLPAAAAIGADFDVLCPVVERLPFKTDKLPPESEWVPLAQMLRQQIEKLDGYEWRKEDARQFAERLAWLERAKLAQASGMGDQRRVEMRAFGRLMRSVAPASDAGFGSADAGLWLAPDEALPDEAWPQEPPIRLDPEAQAAPLAAPAATETAARPARPASRRL